MNVFLKQEASIVRPVLGKILIPSVLGELTGELSINMCRCTQKLYDGLCRRQTQNTWAGSSGRSELIHDAFR